MTCVWVAHCVCSGPLDLKGPPCKVRDMVLPDSSGGLLRVAPDLALLLRLLWLLRCRLLLT